MADKSIEKRINEIIETQRALQEESKELHHLLDMKGKLDELTAKIATITLSIDAETKVASQEDLSEVERKKAELHVAEMKQEQAHYRAESNELQKAILAIGFEQDKKGTFNKHIVFRNIRELMRKKDVKLGQIEKEAGCQPGYMSRLEKEGNTTDPSMEFVMTAARMFDISIDLLVNTRIEALTPTDEYILKFIKNLVDDTREDTLAWEKETQKVCNTIVVENYHTGQTNHPLFTYERIQTDVDDYDERTYYNSRFFRGETVRVEGNSYHARLTSSYSDLYIMDCSKVEGDFPDDEVISFLEMYLVKDSEVNPICCSVETSEPVARAMEDLYKEIEVAANHVHINQQARNAIDSYMKRNDQVSGGFTSLADDDIPF